MSSYFDSLAREVSNAASTLADNLHFYDEVAQIELDAYKEISQLTGDREFPDDLRDRIQATFASRGCFAWNNVSPTPSIVDRVMKFRRSQCLDDVHDLFHELARRGVQTRFGVLRDCPRQALVLLHEWEEEQAERAAHGV